MRTLQDVRDALYDVNRINVSLRMIALKKRDDDVVYHTNKCLAEILKWIDELLEETKP